MGMPACVQHQLESYMRKFLWKGDTSNARVFCKISWKIICKDFDKGGLGVCNLKIRNQSLLFKWLWKLRTAKRDSLWFGVVSSCSLLSNWNTLIYGNGDSISLWHDNWTGNGTAADFYPRLYQLSNCKQSTIRSNGNVGVFDQDQLVWKRSSGGFSAASMAKLINSANTVNEISVLTSAATRGRSAGPGNTAVVFRVNWDSEAPPRVKFFMWTTLHYSTPTLSFLASRTIVSDTNCWCGVYGDLETQNHIFLNCIFARKIWYELFKKLSVSWVMPSSFVDFFVQWNAIISKRGLMKL
ncbi:uncharacterized protein LOC126657189 [Mercurialis annua]|uniref:uncharacterized protein LOC126657189 n=1 Tax=Mercurialis annua TaxID=3986 RepID=UPI00215F054B|nr:uncharacterized protein LOC126657189 [Mercurialis annua]